MKNLERVMLSSQLSLRWEVDVRSNNIANQNTVGFKADRPLFSDYVDPEARINLSPSKEVTFARSLGTYTNFSAGNLVGSSNPLDLAIRGDGFFVVEKDGKVAYTRAGNFRLNELGEIVTNDGAVVQDTGERAIILAANETNIAVAADGSVSTSLGPKGALRVVNFADLTDLVKQGNNSWTTTAEPEDVPEPNIQQGFTEMTNVSPVNEIVSLIRASRRYASTARVVADVNDLRLRASRQLAGLNS